MNAFDRRLAGLHRPARRHGIPIALALAALALLAALAAGCGSSGGTPATTGQGVAGSMQVLTTVQRGDLVQTAMGSVKLVVSKGKTTVVATVPKQFASTVAAGQTATLVFFTPPTGAQGGQSGAPFPQGGQSGAPFPQGGFGGGDFARRGTSGTVTAVTMNSDGTAAATIRLDKRPADISADSGGIAIIQAKVLAAGVIIVPTAAIKGTGGSATVQVISGGNTSTRSVVVGQQSGAESEITSGLNEGENIVYMRSFQRGGFGNGAGGFPGQGQGQSGSGDGQSGGQSNGSVQ